MNQIDSPKKEKKQIIPPRIPNAWIINSGAGLHGFSLLLKIASNLTKGVQDGDGVILVSNQGGKAKVRLFAKIFRIKRQLDSVIFYFDAFQLVDPVMDAAVLELTFSPIGFDRIDWSVFAEAFKKAFGKEVEAMALIEDQAYLRRLLQMAVMDDLLGPANGPLEEVVGMSVRDRYLVGKLAPKETYIGEEDYVS